MKNDMGGIRWCLVKWEIFESMYTGSHFGLGAAGVYHIWPILKSFSCAGHDTLGTCGMNIDHWTQRKMLIHSQSGVIWFLADTRWQDIIFFFTVLKEIQKVPPESLELLATQYPCTHQDILFVSHLFLYSRV